MNHSWSSFEAQLSALTARAQGGDARAFGELYRNLYPLISRYVARRTSNRAEAEDVVALVFERLLDRLGDIDTRKGSVPSFACTIARNLLIDMMRTRKNGIPLEKALAELVEARTPLSELIEQEECAELSRRIDAFPAPLREMLALRYGDGLSCASIAQMFGLSEVTVRKRFSRALRKLRASVHSVAAIGDGAYSP